MIEIDDNTVAAQTSADLITALSTNNLINYVYLANDITIASRIDIYPGKSSVVIDGEYPISSGNANRLTDMNSYFSDDALGVRAASSIQITLKNMNISGRNYYGVPFISDLVDTRGVLIIYDNVTYEGPQMTYNRLGTTRYINCDITIMETTGVSPPEEVGEVSRVELGGNVTINHTEDSDSDAVFWFCDTTGVASLTVLADANVNIVSERSYFMFNLGGLFVTTHVPVSYTVMAGASFNLTTRLGISLNQNHTLDNFNVASGASFRYIQTASNGTLATLYLNAAVSVMSNASFYMQAANGTQPLLYFTSGASRSLNINNPKSFVIYSPNAGAIYSAGTTQLSIQGGQMNIWTTATTPVASAGTFDDTPQFKWAKENYATPLVITGTITATATNITSHNLIAADQPYPEVVNMRLNTARVLSIGDFPLAVNPIVEDGRPITGSSEPYANLRIRYNLQGSSHLLYGQAGEDGIFSVSTSEETPPDIVAGTDVEIEANIPFLIKEITATAVEVGEIIIESSPEEIEFTPPPVYYNPPILPRRIPNEPVVINDSRVDGTSWELLISIAQPLHNDRGEVLEDAVVFVAVEDGQPITVTSQPQVVYTGQWVIGTTNVVWPVREGILVRITEPIRSGVRYSTQLTWTLQTIDEP